MKKLRRSRKNRVVCGVMGGIAEYFDVDPTIVRVLFIICSFSGFPIILYILLAIIIPEESTGYYRDNRRRNTYYYTSGSSRPRKTARRVEEDDDDDWSDFQCHLLKKLPSTHQGSW